MKTFLSNHVLIFLFSETLIYLFALIAFINSLLILKDWNFESTTYKQYKLEKKSYLIVLIIVFLLIFKILLIPYFAYCIDNLSNIVPGAMCGAGVISANNYGKPLLFIKIVTLFLVLTWLIINNEDIHNINYPYFKRKMLFYIIIFFILTIEYITELLYFSNISLNKPVSCCSVIYGFSGDNSIVFGLTTTSLVTIFYLLYILNTILAIQKNAPFLALFSTLFLYIAYLSVIHFFGTYIYELPTHICPFCMLQKDYYFIGYILWGILFLGTFFSIINFLLKITIDKEIDRLYKYSLIFNTIFVILCTLYPIVYFIKNGVFL